MGLLRVTGTCGQHFKVPDVALGDAKKCQRCASTLTVTHENTKRLAAEKEPVPSKPRVGELLIHEGIITGEQLQEALAMQKKQGGKTVQNRIALQYIDPSTFVNFLSKLPSVASMDLTNYNIPKDVTALIPVEYVRKHEILPIDKMGKDLTVGMACPLDAKTIAELEEMTSLKIRPLLVSLSDIKAAIDGYYPDDSDATSEEGATGTEASTEGAISLIESALALIRNVKALPALRETVHQVRETMEDPESSAADMARIIRTDPALSEKLISLANSAAFGFMHKVESVETATALLGLREVYNVATASAGIDYFEASKHFDYKAFWKRSMFCGTAPRSLRKRWGKKKPAVSSLPACSTTWGVPSSPIPLRENMRIWTKPSWMKT